MKQVLISALVAAAVSFVVVHLPLGEATREAPAAAAEAPNAPPARAHTFRVTGELVEDGWVDGARTAGADYKPLEHAANSICYLTKIELKGIQGPEDARSCTIGIDEFTGFWQVTAAVEEGGQSEVRCNARCLIWE